MLAARPGKLSNGPLPPPRDQGEGSPAPRPRGPRSRPSHARLQPEGGRWQRRQANPVAEASRRTHGRNTTLPRRPDGSLRGAHWGQQVLLQARAPGKRCGGAAGTRRLACWSAGANLEIACASCMNTLWRGLRSLFNSLLKGNTAEAPKFSVLPRGLEANTSMAFTVPHISLLNNCPPEFQEYKRLVLIFKRDF